MKYPLLPGNEGLVYLDNLLAEQSYVEAPGHSPGLPDLEVYECLMAAGGPKKLDKFENVQRWCRDITYAIFTY